MIYGVGFPGGTGGGKTPQIVGSCMDSAPYTTSNRVETVTQTYTISYREGYDSYDFLVITPQVPPILAYTTTTTSSQSCAAAGGHSNGNTENIIIKGSGKLLLYTLIPATSHTDVGTYRFQEWQYQATDTNITLTASLSSGEGGGYFSCVAYKY